MKELRSTNYEGRNTSVKRRHSSISTIAFTTPVSGLVNEGNSSMSRSNVVRCVIHGRVSIWPISMSPMMRLSPPAVRCATRIQSFRAGATADRKAHLRVHDADKHQPAGVCDVIEAPDMDCGEPVASNTNPAKLPPVISSTADRSLSSPLGTARRARRRTFAGRTSKQAGSCRARSSGARLIERTPKVAKPIGPAPTSTTQSPWPGLPRFTA